RRARARGGAPRLRAHLPDDRATPARGPRALPRHRLHAALRHLAHGRADRRPAGVREEARGRRRPRGDGGVTAAGGPPSAARPGAVRVVGIGAGPAGIMVLERLLANHARDTPELRLEITLVDPHEPGG